MSIVDNPNDKKTTEKAPETNSEFDLDSLAVSEPEEATPNANPQPESDDLPEKYRGKSVADIARMHQELEQKFGQQGNEVGELRKTLDQYILSRLQDGDTKQDVEPDVTDDDFFSSPKEAVSKYLNKDPEIQRLKEAAARAEQAALVTELKNKHGDFEQVLQDKGFQDWVKGSKLRQRLLVEADRNYDVEAADELFSEWKTLQKGKQEATNTTVEAEKQARVNEIKKASTGTARGNSAGRSSKKVYRRQDIVELMRDNPRRYEALAADIRKAYEEGRVR
jgi:hypothetical protein